MPQGPLHIPMRYRRPHLRERLASFFHALSALPVLRCESACLCLALPSLYQAVRSGRRPRRAHEAHPLPFLRGPPPCKRQAMPVVQDRTSSEVTRSPTGHWSTRCRRGTRLLLREGACSSPGCWFTRCRALSDVSEFACSNGVTRGVAHFSFSSSSGPVSSGHFGRSADSGRTDAGSATTRDSSPSHSGSLDTVTANFRRLGAGDSDDVDQRSIRGPCRCARRTSCETERRGAVGSKIRWMAAGSGGRLFWMGWGTPLRDQFTLDGDAGGTLHQKYASKQRVPDSRSHRAPCLCAIAKDREYLQLLWA